jgi:prophage regulatory protein
MKKSLDRVVRKPEALNRVGLSDPTVWRMEREGKFPKRIHIGPQSVGWLESELIAWLEKKKQARE